MSTTVGSTGTSGLTRRAFVSASSLAALGLGLAGCSPKESKVEETDKDGATLAQLNYTDDEGEWLSVACWHNCGGGCYNRALVKDGVVVRQKTDDILEDTPENPQLRACLRGHSQRKQVFHEGRLKYPMKRAHWEPGGGDKSLRGRDEWVRISWDEALDIVADEAMKVIKEVGTRGILCTDDANWGAGNVWKIFPGIPEVGGLPTTVWDTASEGSYCLKMSALGMPDFDLYPYRMGSVSSNDRYDMLNADTIIMYGTNPVWASAGNRAYYFMQAKNNGTEFVYVGPSRNVSAALLDARWIPVRPGTDIALLLAAAYVMLRDDPDDELVDWDFLDKYTVGFTIDNLPDDAKLEECFKDYVLGEYDGVPKTPEWATEICGTPVEDIEFLAHANTKQKNVMLLHSFAAARNTGAENFPQMFLTFGCMGGHIGREGNATGAMFNFSAGDNGPSFFQSFTSYAAPAVNNQGGDVINANQMWTAVLDGTYNYVGNPIPTDDWRPGETREIDIRMIYNEDTAGMQTRPAIMKGVEAMRKVDFVVTHALFLTTAARYSDVVLPIISQWETDDPAGRGDRGSRTFSRKVCEPLYECRSDIDICRELMTRFGEDPASVFPLNEKQSYMNKVKGTLVLNKEGEYVPLVTVTQEQLDEYGLDDEPQEGLITFDEILETGIYRVERSPEDPPAYRYIAYQDFIKDPEANPLASNSGKFEIYCQWKADTLNALGFRDDVEFKPYATWTADKVGYMASFKDWKTKEQGDYPFLCYEPHYLRRAHSNFNNVEWMREAFQNPVYINASDAKDKGIADGDTVLITGEHGKVLRRASLMESVMPGCIGLPHGSWLDLDDETGIDHGGTDEVICGPVPGYLGVSGYNNFCVNIEKYDEETLDPDCDWPARVVDYQ